MSLNYISLVIKNAYSHLIPFAFPAHVATNEPMRILFILVLFALAFPGRAVPVIDCSQSFTGIQFNKRALLRGGKTLEVALVQESDAPDVVSYLNEVAGESDNLSFGNGELWRNVDQQRLLIRSNIESGQLFLKGIVDEKLVALVSIDRLSTRPRLSHVGDFSISVRQSHWRLGIAKILMREALEISRQMRLSKITLRVIEKNAEAIQLYLSMGFVIEGLSKNAIRVNGNYMNLVLMSLMNDELP